jgi:Zn-dependent protease
LRDLSFALALVATALVSFHMYSYDGTLLIVPLIIMLNDVFKRAEHYSVSERVFFSVLFALFFPLLPNVLLSAAVLAWWALPLPVLFGVIAIRVWRRSQGDFAATESVAVSIPDESFCGTPQHKIN